MKWWERDKLVFLNFSSKNLWPQAEDLVKQKFEFPLPDVEDQDDPLMKGEFMVMLELMQELPGAKEGKEKVKVYVNNITKSVLIPMISSFKKRWYFANQKVDRIINLCGPGPRGTGLQNLREAIIQTKWKYDLAMEDKQVQFYNPPAFLHYVIFYLIFPQKSWKARILSFMER